MTFEQWEKAVNLELERTVGLGLDDLPDWGTYDAWADDMSVTDAAKEIVQYAHTF